MHQELVDHVGNPLGTSWEHLGSDKNPGQKKKKSLGPQVHAASPHWLEEFFFLAYRCSLPILA
jgi:hypothetical protein